MDLLNPNVGLVFWMLLSFGILLVLLKKFAWKPILTSIQNREESINKALSAAAEAEQKLSSLKAENEALLAEARKERDTILKEAREIKEKMIADAKAIAATEAENMIANARENINAERMKAVIDLRNQVATLAVEVAEKIIRKELASTEQQKQLIESSLNDVKLN